MHLTERQIVEFIRLYKTQFGKDLSQAEALEKSLSLVRLVQAVLKENKQQGKGRTT